MAKTLNVKPKLLERKKIVPRVLDKIIGFVEKFYDFVGSDVMANIQLVKDILSGKVSDYTIYDIFSEENWIMRVKS